MACASTISMPIPRVPPQATPPRDLAIRLTVGWAQCESDVRAAQQLRWQVFVQEMGARVPGDGSAGDGLEVDGFDPYCEHLLVRAHGPGLPSAGQVVGTYRLLGPGGARAAGGYYTDTEFDLAALAPLRGRAVELGRSCVHADWRLGSVIMSMWGALGTYLRERRLDTMIGCASVGLADGGLAAAALWQELRHSHLADACWHVQPRKPLPLRGVSSTGTRGVRHGPSRSAIATAPPLVKGYLRCGARLLGPPALDAAFNTADLPLMLRTADMTPRYRRHFLGAA